LSEKESCISNGCLCLVDHVASVFRFLRLVFA
jgi:hypothetical protein